MPENLTRNDVSVDNYRNLRLDIRPVLPDPATIAAAADALAQAIKQRKSVIALLGFGAIAFMKADAYFSTYESFS